MDEAPGPSLVVGIVFFHGVDELAATAPYAVFTALRRLQIQSADRALPETHVLAITRTPGIIHGANGLRFLPDYDLTMCPDLDVLIVPGSGEIGEPTVPEMEQGGLWDFVHDRASRARAVAGVGTGSLVLAKAGVLTGKTATTQRPYLERLTRFDGVTTSEQGIVEDGAVWTARSGAWGVRLGLALIARLVGDEAARRVGHELGHEAIDAGLP